MATTGTTLINSVLSRVRDANAQLNATDSPPTTTAGRAAVLLFLNHSQIFVSVGEHLLVNTFALALTNGQVIYDLNALVSDFGGAVVGVNVAGAREIDGPVDWKALGRASRTWQTDTVTAGVTAPLSWAPIGHTLLALYPAMSAGSTTATVRYRQVPTFLAAEANNISIPDFASEHMARMAELISRIKTRQLTGFGEKLQSLQTDMEQISATFKTGGKAD